MLMPKWEARQTLLSLHPLSHSLKLPTIPCLIVFNLLQTNAKTPACCVKLFCCLPHSPPRKFVGIRRSWQWEGVKGEVPWVVRGNFRYLRCQIMMENANEKLLPKFDAPLLFTQLQLSQWLRLKVCFNGVDAPTRFLLLIPAPLLSCSVHKSCYQICDNGTKEH